jgi:predicted deacylase
VNAVDSDGGRIFAVASDAIEVEGGTQRSPAAAENAVRAGREFLAATGALAGIDPPEPRSVPVYRLGGPVPKAQAERYAVHVDNFEEVAAGEAFASVDEEDVVADTPFYPVLMSAEGYEEVFGYRAQREGSLP